MPGKRIPALDLSNLTDLQREKVKEISDQFLLDSKKSDQLIETLERELDQGFSADPSVRSKTSLQNENTFIHSLIDGSENGDFLALDLGGTNFRVLLCSMEDGKCTSTSKNYNVPKDKLRGPAAGVFDHIADSIHKFLVEENLLGKSLPLGFTFSFPMVQKSLKEGILVTWTKSFACPDGVGEDAVKMLEDAMKRKGDFSVEVVAVLNDTTGTLLAGSYLDHQCGIGLILGTGSNAAYLENVDRIERLKGGDIGHNKVVIDTEWGAFGDNGSLNFIKNKYDAEIDNHSNHKGSFGFEKLYSGHYVGDLARLVMVDLITAGVLFKPDVLDILSEWNFFKASHISRVERGQEKEVLEGLGIKSTANDLTIVKYICNMLTLRCAQIVCCALSVLVNRMEWSLMTIAIDGSVYRHSPTLHGEMMAWLEELCPGTQLKLIDALDGSGRGAAFAAAVAIKERQQCG